MVISSESCPIAYGLPNRSDLESGDLSVHPHDEGLVELDEALTRLAVQHPELAELVQLRHFGGMTLAESAEVLGISPRTADTWWSYARAWLAIELKEHSGGNGANGKWGQPSL